MHLFAWGLVVVLVWSHWSDAPKPQQDQFVALAELDQGVYVAAMSGDSRFSLIRYKAGQLGRRSLKLDDWERDFDGQIVGLCAVKGYSGEFVAAVSKLDVISIVHVQVRNWRKTPKSAILGRVSVPQSENREPLSAMSCGMATQETMPIMLFGQQGQGYAMTLHFNDLHLTDLAQVEVQAQITSAFQDTKGRWESIQNVDMPSSSIFYTPEGGESTLRFTLDGFLVRGIAQGPEGYPISVITYEPGLGSLWRPLK